MSELSATAADVGFLVDRFASRVPGVRDAIVVSADGLLMARSAGISREGGDRFAAIASGLIGLAQGAAVPFDGGRVTELVIEMERGFIFVTGIGEGSAMAVMAEAGCDIGVVGYEMARLAERCGEVFTPELRAELQNALPR